MVDGAAAQVPTSLIVGVTLGILLAVAFAALVAYVVRRQRRRLPEIPKHKKRNEPPSSQGL